MAFFHSNFMLQISHQDHDHNQPSTTSLTPLIPSCNNSQEFHGSLLGKRMSGIDGGYDEDMNNIHRNHHSGDDEFSDDGCQMGDKKRRLNMEQVRTLEKNFELGNKLEPERKMQLARALGLQPRQIAIWFQNRRARWKTKQLEKDYELLKRQFDAVKAENDALLAHNHKLQSEILGMKSTREPTESINLNKETEGSCSNRSENSSEIKLDIARNNNNRNNYNPSIVDSPLSANPDSVLTRPIFPSSLRPNGVAQQLFRSCSRPEMQCTKMEQNVSNNNNNKEESPLSNMMFCGMDDQTGFWPWLDQQPFN